MKMPRIAAVVLIALAIAGCSADSDPGTEVEGIVTQVTGSGDDVEAFVVVDDEGRNHRFVPFPTLTCGGEPLGHLRTHLVDQDPIRVEYEVSEDGLQIAIDIDHLP